MNLFIDEPQLVSRLKARDRNAFTYLYDYYSPALYGIILRVVKNEEIAEEVLQDSFFKVWDCIGQYTATRGRLFTWLFKVARNLAVDKLRSKEIQRDLKTNSVADSVHDINNKYHHQQITDAIGIEKLLNHLPKNQQLIINLLYLQGYTHAEVAKEYDIPLGTVKTRHRKALIHLRQLIKNEM